MRVTDLATMDVVQMVLGGLVTQKSSRSLIPTGRVVGVTGKDGDLIQGKDAHDQRIERCVPAPEIIDIGHVGRITNVQGGCARYLIQSEFIPVIAPVGVGKNVESFNINADIVAGAVAQALGAESSCC